MLPLPYQQCFEELQQALAQVERMLRSGANAVDLKAALTQIQQLFQSQVLSLNLDVLPAELEHRVYSFQVEIDKQLRLLGMDLTFLQAARQVETIAQRRHQAGERAEILLRYCEALLGEGEEKGWDEG
jgi:hypothetical protein